MQIKKTIGASFPGSVESPPLEDVVVLVDSAGVALGVQRAFSARMRGGRDGGSGRIASRCVEIPLVGSGGEVSGILCHTGPVVADDGEGMPEEILSKAFTPYLTTKAAGSGTGLGLLQVQRFAEGRGGANTWRPVQRWSS
jgi:hypothetical protein